MANTTHQEFQPVLHEGYQELNPEAENTILLVGGITEGVATQQAFAENLAGEGYRVVSFDYNTTRADTRAPGYFGRHHQPKIDQTVELLDRVVPEGKKASIFAHSQGAVFAVEAALAHPDKVDEVVLANPAGLFRDTFPRLFGRFALETVRKTLTLKRTALLQQYEGTKHLVKNPRDFIGDAVDVAKSDITLKLRRLQQQGIKLHMLGSAKDRVFPWRLQREFVERQNTKQFVFDSVSSYFNTKPSGKQHKFASKWAGHDQNIVYPEQTAKLVKQLIEQ